MTDGDSPRAYRANGTPSIRRPLFGGKMSTPDEATGERTARLRPDAPDAPSPHSRQPDAAPARPSTPDPAPARSGQSDAGAGRSRQSDASSARSGQSDASSARGASAARSGRSGASAGRSGSPAASAARSRHADESEVAEAPAGRSRYGGRTDTDPREPAGYAGRTNGARYGERTGTDGSRYAGATGSRQTARADGTRQPARNGSRYGRAEPASSASRHGTGPVPHRDADPSGGRHGTESATGSRHAADPDPASRHLTEATTARHGTGAAPATGRGGPAVRPRNGTGRPAPRHGTEAAAGSRHGTDAAAGSRHGAEATAGSRHGAEATAGARHSADPMVPRGSDARGDDRTARYATETDPDIQRRPVSPAARHAAAPVSPAPRHGAPVREAPVPVSPAARQATAARPVAVPPQGAAVAPAREERAEAGRTPVSPAGGTTYGARPGGTDDVPDGPIDDLEPGAHRREPRLVAELRVVGMVVRRELKKYLRSKAKILSSFVQPFFFLLIFGYGMRTLVRTTGGVSFEAFVFPGVIAMTVLGRALLSAVTIVQDREFGFLREMLVSPASRISIVIGAILGGATISTVQAVLLFAGAPVMGLFPGPMTILSVLAGTGLMAVEVTALGVALATFISKPQSFTAVTQALTYPMLVLSGALVPLSGLPSWVARIATFNLFSYPVDAIRRLLIGSHVEASGGSMTGLVLLGHPMSVPEELLVTAGCTLLFLVIAAWRFARVT